GIITCCNEDFLRVGAYPAEELLGEPHNTIRHPHMPRSVFKLLSDYLLAGKSIGAYVKNLAKTGEYYWVYALAAPIDDGFLSIRLKPTSGIFDKIPALYSKLLEIEESYGPKWRDGMSASSEALLTEVSSLGLGS